jgi:mRNA degradation ribonuclease J1/J2
MKAVLARHGVPIEVCHVSGHAYIPNLKSLVGAIKPDRVIPIHTAEPARYHSLFPKVEVRRDKEWWSA